MNGVENYNILDGRFCGFYKEWADLEKMNFRERWFIYDASDEVKRMVPIPKDYQKVYELYKRIRDVFKSTDNMQEILCPDLVKVIMTEDFYKRLGKSIDENKKIRPEILFEGYRKDAEVEDDRKNTAKSDDDLDL